MTKNTYSLTRYYVPGKPAKAHFIAPQFDFVTAPDRHQLRTILALAGAGCGAVAVLAALLVLL